MTKEIIKHINETLDRMYLAEKAKGNDVLALKYGDLVRKKSGSNWHGRVVGAYTTKLNPAGVAVENYFEEGSVQIYPIKALVWWK